MQKTVLLKATLRRTAFLYYVQSLTEPPARIQFLSHFPHIFTPHLQPLILSHFLHFFVSPPEYPILSHFLHFYTSSPAPHFVSLSACFHAQPPEILPIKKTSADSPHCPVSCIRISPAGNPAPMNHDTVKQKLPSLFIGIPPTSQPSSRFPIIYQPFCLGISPIFDLSPNLCQTLFSLPWHFANIRPFIQPLPKFSSLPLGISPTFDFPSNLFQISLSSALAFRQVSSLPANHPAKNPRRIQLGETPSPLDSASKYSLFSLISPLFPQYSAPCDTFYPSKYAAKPRFKKF